ncbi:hypothetical protein CG428_21825 [Pantoea ananatis]|nr:hypothetical protein CG428_21825 [Pantoea ananatis]
MPVLSLLKTRSFVKIASLKPFHADLISSDRYMKAITFYLNTIHNSCTYNFTLWLYFLIMILRHF